MKKEAKHIESLFKLLISQDKYPFPEPDKEINIPKKHGVYVIYNSEDRVVYVGRTQLGKNGLKNRFKNHLYGMSSFTKNYLNDDGNKLRKGYKFKYILLKNGRERALVESLAIGTLCPEYVGIGKRRKVKENKK